MELLGRTAFVTGGGSGIGRELCLQLASKGCRVTVADLNGDMATSVCKEISSSGKEALAITVDVTDDRAMANAFQQHLDRFHGLHIVCLNAGISEKGDLLSSKGDWAQTLDIDLRAQISGTLLALRAMEASNSKGAILYTASAGGIYPMPSAPVYAAAKAGLIHFARSMSARLQKRGIRVYTICPQYVDTPLVRGVSKAAFLTGSPDSPLNFSENLLTPSQVAACGIQLIADESKQGIVAFLPVSGKLYKYNPNSSLLRRASFGKQASFDKPCLVDPAELLKWAQAPRPSFVHRVQVFRLSNDFRAATRIVKERCPTPKHGHVLVRRAYAGVNASDVNFTSGKYFGSPEESQKRLPFYAGFESVGVVADIGKGVKGLNVGDCVAELSYGTFSEWGTVSEKLALRAPTCSPEIVALLTSGLTASIGLEVAGKLASDETVLVTAAAGGTGQFAVQLAKLAGNHVIATCGSPEKAALLRRLGADRVVNYNKEDLKAVLKTEYPKGVNLAWESVGGSMFDTCTKSLANSGRLVVIGMMSQYSSGWKPSMSKGLPELLLQKSASLHGFFLPQYSRLYKAHLKRLTELWVQGRLQVNLDPTKFVGVEKSSLAVEHLQQGGSYGKVILQLANTVPNRPVPSRL